MLLLLACVFYTADEQDLDGDGHLGAAFGGDDCDEKNATVHPGAEELCDGADNDCDGAVEPYWQLYADLDGDGIGGAVAEDCSGRLETGGDCDDADPAIGAESQLYVDADEDGWGDTEGLIGCPDTGLVQKTGDCDDTDASVSPDAEELCNQVDDDCDGNVDEEAVDATEVHVDQDGDGWGADDPVLGCDTTGQIGGDCDDTNPAINPGAEEDYCTEADDNCDGSVADAPTTPLAQYGGEAGGTSGLGYDLAMGTPSAYGEVLAVSSQTAASVLLFDPDRGTAQDSTDRWARIIGAGEQVWVGPAWARDDDDDDDVVVSDSTWSSGRGRVSILQLSPGGGDAEVEDAAVHYEGAEDGDGFGAAMRVREIEVDGEVSNSFLTVGAPGAGGGSGSAYLLSISETVTGDVPIDDAGAALITTSASGAALGSAIELWLDAAGGWWSVIGAPGWDGDHGAAGAVFVCHYGDVSDYDLGSQCTAWIGDLPGDGFGLVISIADVDGDGVEDAFIGAPTADRDGVVDAGAAWVISGEALPLGNAADPWDTTDTEITLSGTDEGQTLGRSLAMADGRLFLGASFDDCGADDAGTVFAADYTPGSIEELGREDTIFRAEVGSAVGTALLAVGDGTAWVGATGGSWAGLVDGE